MVVLNYRHILLVWPLFFAKKKKKLSLSSRYVKIPIAGKSYVVSIAVASKQTVRGKA